MRLNLLKKGQLPLSFAVLIICGALLLLLPGLLRNGGRLTVLDALFTSCSAVCLNGLSVVPLPEFNFFGQLIILLLIQLGCFGILALSAIILLMLGRGLSFSDTLVMYNLNDRFSLGCTEALLRTIATYTLVSEAVGFVLMLPGFLLGGFGILDSLWYALFYSVGSFCNSGLGPLAADIAGAGRYVQAVSIGLIVLGGIGVYVIYDMVQKFHKKEHRIRLHSRIVLTMTAILLISGAVILYLISFAPDGKTLEFFDALYMSATARTAGYASVPVGSLPSAAVTVIMILMLIGGSPGSAAGGIKTSTVAVAFAALISSFKGEGEVIILKRSIAWRSVLRSFTIIVIFLLFSLIGTVLLGVFSPQLDDQQCIFEAVSALSGTGLTLNNATQLLSAGGKVIIGLLMFAGRVGPLSIILFFVGREKPGALRYPEERVIVG